ncbi:MAG: CHAT domain-containing protein [Aureispira sp.]
MENDCKTVLLNFFYTKENLNIFVVRKDWKERNIFDTKPIILKSKINVKNIEYVVDRLAKDVSITRRRKEVNDISLDFFYELGTKIFTDELYQLIKGYDGIYFVPFKKLHNLPLHAMLLPNGNTVIDEYMISYLPSASSIQLIRYQNNNIVDSPREALVVGVDGSNDDPLFLTEATQVTNQLDHFGIKTCILKDRAANKKEVLNNLKNKNIVHFSTHGHFPELFPENLETSQKLDELINNVKNKDLVFSKGIPQIPEASVSSGIELYYTGTREILTVDEIKNLSSNIDGTQIEILVSTACLVGRSENRLGDELVGVTRSLLYLGVCNIISAMFKVYKKVTVPRTFLGKKSKTSTPSFARFYYLWLEEKMSKSRAFQKYIQEIKSKDNSIDYSHPFFWFSYTYTGILE